MVIINYVVFTFRNDDPNCILEQAPLKSLANERQLAVYLHQGFWAAMDTARDIWAANELWNQGNRLGEVW